MLVLALIWSVALSYEVQCIEEEDGQCVRCPRGYIVNQRLNACVWNRASEPPIICPEGYFLDNGLCTLCHSSCETCTGSAEPNGCTVCAQGYYPAFTEASGLCIPCSTSHGVVAGIPGCVHCARDGDSLYCFERRQLKSNLATIRKTLVISLVVLVLALFSSLILIFAGGSKIKHRQRRLPVRYVARHKMV